MDQSSSQPDDPRIERVEAIAVQVPLSRVFEGSGYRVTHRTAVISRIYGEGGLLGEGLNMVGETAMLAQVVKVVVEEIAPALRGMLVLSPEACWRQMDRVTDRVDRDPRAAIRAMACVDTAIWDAVGKSFAQPLYRIWGGYRRKIPVIANAGYHGGDPAAFGEEMIELRELGIGGCKFKVGSADPATDAQKMRAAREAVGDAFVLCADANRAWTRDQAVDFCRRVEGLGLRWLEEPCRWRNARSDDRYVRQVTGVPVCAGQSEIAGQGCRDLMFAGAIDICNFDASWGGGPTEWRRVAGMAANFSVEMSQHGEPHLGAHLVTAIAHGTYMETHHPDRDPIFHGMIVSRAPFRNGYYQVPDLPGWGVEIDWEMMNRYRLN